jgi:hypothetical protein
MDTSLSKESQVVLDDMQDINSIQIPLVLFATIVVFLALIFLIQILAIIALIITINPDLAKQRKTWVTPTLKCMLRAKAVRLEKKLPSRPPTPRTTPPPYTNLGTSEESPHLAAKFSVHSAVPSASPFDIKPDPTGDGLPAGGADPNQSSRNVSQYLRDSHNQLMLLEQQHEKSQVTMRRGEDSLGTFECGMPADQLCAGQPGGSGKQALQDYQMQLALLKQHGGGSAAERRAVWSDGGPVQAVPIRHTQPMLLEQRKQRMRIIMMAQQQQHAISCGGASLAPTGNGMQAGQPAVGQLGGSGNLALQDYQMQLMLLEQQNKKRLMMARQEQDSKFGQDGSPPNMPIPLALQDPHGPPGSSRPN